MDDIIYVARYPSGNEKAGIISIGGVARTLTATDYKQPLSVLIPISFANGQVIKEIDTSHCLQAEALQKESVMMKQEMTKVMAVLTPDRAEKRQNGRRFKDDGEEQFTLTSQDIHGVAFSVSGNNASESEDISHCLNANDQRKVFGAHQTKTMVGEPLIKVKEATSQGYAIAHEGDSINLSMPNSQTRRGRIGGGVAQTLDTSCNQGTMVTIPSDNHESIYVEIYPGTSVYAVWYEKYQCYIAIRKLTPRECFRLQGWNDEYFERAQFVNSDSQLYKQAGNGITVNVVRDIALRINEVENGTNNNGKI